MVNRQQGWDAIPGLRGSVVKYGFSFSIPAVYRSARIWRNYGLMACASARSAGSSRVGRPTLDEPAERAATKPEFLPKRSPYFTLVADYPKVWVIGTPIAPRPFPSGLMPFFQEIDSEQRLLLLCLAL